MRKIIIALFFCLIVAFCPINDAFAINRTLLISEVLATPQSEVKIQLSITNASQLANADILLTYDQSILDLKNVRANSLFPNLNLTYNSDPPDKISIKITAKPPILNGAGPLVDMIFTIKPNSPIGAEALIQFKEANVYDADKQPIEINLQDGGVKLIESCVKGDVYKDGKIDSRDAILTLQISAGIIAPTPYQVCAADVNGDGTITAKDASKILRIAVELDPPIE